MNAKLNPIEVDVKGSPVRVLQGGAGGTDVLPMVLFDGAAPGVTPYGTGAHVWGDVLDRFVEEGPVFVVDGAGAPAFNTFDELQQYLAATLEALSLPRCHVVGHDNAGLAALLLASQSPRLFAGITVVDSGSAAPTGDGVENVTFAYPPFEPGSPKAQRWALERLSYAHTHIDAGLLVACERTARNAHWTDAVARMSQGPAARRWHGSLMRAKARLFEACRNQPGVPVPVQVVWGTHDPLASMDQGLWLYRLIAAHQPIAHFHAVNRSGAMPFREGPETFHQVVAAFRDALMEHTTN